MEKYMDEKYIEKCIVVNRDEHGFGLRVGGQNPVFVDHVHENGAAWRAGVRQDDKIIKVNGTNVRSYDHQRVVQMIQECQKFVNLTLHTPYQSVLANSGASDTLVINSASPMLSPNSYSVTRRCASSVEPSGATGVSGSGGLTVTSNLAVAPRSSNLQPHKRHRSLPASHSGQTNPDALGVEDGAFNHVNNPLQNFIPSGTVSSSCSASTSAPAHHHHHHQQQHHNHHTHHHHGTSHASKQSSSTLKNHNQSTTSSAPSISERVTLNGHNFINYCDTAMLYCNGCDRPLFAWFTYACTSCEVYSHRWCLKKASETACLDTYKGGSSSTSGGLSSTASSVASTLASKMSSSSKSHRSRIFGSRRVDLEALKTLKLSASTSNASSSHAPQISSSSSSSSLSDVDTWFDSNITSSNNNNVLPNAQHSTNSTCTLGAHQSSEDLLSFNDHDDPSSSSITQSQSSHTLTQTSSGVQQLGSNTKSTENLCSSPHSSQTPDTVSSVSAVGCPSSPLQATVTNSDNNAIVAPSVLLPSDYRASVRPPRATTKRLEIIKELLETERTHVSRLKHLDKLFYKPMVKESMMTPEQFASVFSCHKRLYRIHKQIFATLMSVRKDFQLQQHRHSLQYQLTHNSNSNNNSVVAHTTTTVPTSVQQMSKSESTSAILQQRHPAEPMMGYVLTCVFLADVGRQLEQASCEFCACQAVNRELLNKLTRRDSKAADFLAQAANQPSIGRLGIKDLLAACFQRLTKYPLLLDNLLNNTPADVYGQDERDQITQALKRSRDILVRVNEAVKMSVSRAKLHDIWRRTDKQASVQPNIDIDTQQLLHDGPLTFRITKNRAVDVHVLLMSDYLVILTKSDSQDRFKLRHISSDGSKSTNHALSPLFMVDEDLVTRKISTDENAFYLICKRKEDSRMYELGAQSPADKDKWRERIQAAVASKRGGHGRPVDYSSADHYIVLDNTNTLFTPAPISVAGTTANSGTSNNNTSNIMNSSSTNSLSKISGASSIHVPQVHEKLHKIASQSSLNDDTFHDNTPSHAHTGNSSSFVQSNKQQSITTDEQHQQRNNNVDSELRHLFEQKCSLVCQSFGISNRKELDVIADASENDERHGDVRFNVAYASMCVAELMCDHNRPASQLRDAALKLRSHIDAFLQHQSDRGAELDASTVAPVNSVSTNSNSGIDQASSVS